MLSSLLTISCSKEDNDETLKENIETTTSKMT